MKEIILFKRCLVTSDTLSVEEVNKLAITKGYAVNPLCCNSRVVEYLNTLPSNYNTTFYSSFEEVLSKSRFEIFIEQLLHYISTYGTNFSGTPYVPNTDGPVINFTECKAIIQPITVEEIANKIQQMLNSGIALKQDTIEILLELAKELDIEINVDAIKNKEALILLCAKGNLLPSAPEEFLRYLIYLYTNTTLLIKSRKVITTIKSNPKNISSLIERFGIEKLAQIFYRFKPIFLAMKPENTVIINKLRKLAKKHHKPKEFGYWATILAEGKETHIFKLNDKIKELNNYKLISLMNTIMVRKRKLNILAVIVRNGKVYIKERETNSTKALDAIYSRLTDELIGRLSKKACKVKLPSVLKLALPTSEKSFIGNIPYGSYIEIENNDFLVGINWKKGSNSNDLDLSLLDTNGNKVGWNAWYYIGTPNSYANVIYSGDMVGFLKDRDESTEILYCNGKIEDCCIKVNLFSNESARIYMEDDEMLSANSLPSKFTFFVAKAHETNKAEYSEVSPIIDPNDIVFSTELSLTSNGEKEKILGMFVNNVFVFMNFISGNQMVSRCSTHLTNFISLLNKTNDCFLSLDVILQQAGFEFVEEDPEIDFSIMDKSLLINLLA